MAKYRRHPQKEGDNKFNDYIKIWAVSFAALAIVGLIL